MFKGKRFLKCFDCLIFFYISNLKKLQVSDESDLSAASDEERVLSSSKKKKKSHVIQEKNLSKEEKTRAETIAALCVKYKCDLHKTPCFIQENWHLQLNLARLQL